MAVEKVLRYIRLTFLGEDYTVGETAIAADGARHELVGFIFEPSSKPGFYQLNLLFKDDPEDNLTRYFLASMSSIIMECVLEDAPAASKIVIPQTPPIRLEDLKK